MKALSSRFPALAYVAPFAVFAILLGLRGHLPIAPFLDYPLRTLLTLATLLAVSRPLLQFGVKKAWASIAIGLLVFFVWVCPDLLWPHYREHWLFRNTLLGSGRTALPAVPYDSHFFLVFRVLGSALLVPVIEELFWRGWLMRWLIRKDFLNEPLGKYVPSAFWITAILFASEHGPYWDVGLAAGLLYNWWMIRTRSLADCILAHAVTNACLAVYVLRDGKWQYWL
ncbi:MAG: CAAX prenyl protease-related protein [Acidobacteria bacterium]|nr:CAAX prenyl protease-related protein [Acidobacteriota bacterium]